MMPRYLVFMRISGHASIEVEASDEADAIREAAGSISFDDVDDWDTVASSGDAELIEDNQP